MTIQRACLLHYHAPTNPSCTYLAKNLKNTTCISPKPKSTRKDKKKRHLGKNLGPWQEGKVGNDPSGWNPRRVVGDGDPAPFLGRRARDGVGNRDEWVWGS